MILSHSHKFIFLHVPKVAGASMNEVFRSYDMTFWAGLFTKGAKLRRHKGRLKVGFAEHIKAKQLKDKMSSKTFEEYYKFAFVRNPWEREVSWYKWILKTKVTPKLTEQVSKLKDFNDFVLWFADNLPKLDSVYDNQKDFIYDDKGSQLVNFIGRYENLEGDFRKILEEVGLPLVTLPVKNATKEKNTENAYRKLYNERSIELVAQLRSADIHIFGYEF